MPDAAATFDSVSASSITLNGTTITSWPSGGGEPAAYLKSASVSGSILTLTKKDDTTVTFTGEPSAYIKSASVSGNTLTLTKKDDTTVTFTPSTGTTTLSGLTDTTVSSPSNGQVLKYNSTTSKWENGTVSTGSSVSTTIECLNGTATVTNGVITSFSQHDNNLTLSLS